MRFRLSREVSGPLPLGSTIARRQETTIETFDADPGDIPPEWHLQYAAEVLAQRLASDHDGVSGERLGEEWMRIQKLTTEAFDAGLADRGISFPALTELLKAGGWEPPATYYNHPADAVIALGIDRAEEAVRRLTGILSGDYLLYLAIHTLVAGIFARADSAEQGAAACDILKHIIGDDAAEAIDEIKEDPEGMLWDVDRSGGPQSDRIDMCLENVS